MISLSKINSILEHYGYCIEDYSSGFQEEYHLMKRDRIADSWERLDAPDVEDRMDLAKALDYAIYAICTDCM